MSILIKGMEMPHDCDECRLCAFIPVGDYGIYRKCLPLNAKAEITIRRANCPLIPVQPHGDLIDRNAILKAYGLSTSKVDCTGCKYKNEVRCPKYELCEALNDAPTIIPADGGET